jgi:phosphatidylserine decarboxylase
MSQYEKPDPKDYANFNDFFARKIKPERRPVASAQDDVRTAYITIMCIGFL